MRLLPIALVVAAVTSTAALADGPCVRPEPAACNGIRTAYKTVMEFRQCKSAYGVWVVKVLEYKACLLQAASTVDADLSAGNATMDVRHRLTDWNGTPAE